MNKIRQEFADTMREVGEKDPKLVVLIGDISHFILQPFAKACPDRLYNVGICEQTIVGMAAGLAKIGLYPVVHTITPFIVERSFEQIKLDFGYQKLGVNIVTVGSAFDYTGLGCTHHCYDDFAILKNIENMQIVYPAGPQEFRQLFMQTYRNGKPTYFRIPEHQHGVTFKKEKIRFGKGIIVKKGTNLTIIALGPQLNSARDALPELKKIGCDPEILYFPTVKPLDEALIRESLEKTRRCLIIEEHHAYGGVFDDVLRKTRDIGGVRYETMNTGQSCIHHYGTYQEICAMLGLSSEGVVSTVKKMFRKHPA